MLQDFEALGWVCLFGFGWFVFATVAILAVAGIRRLWQCR